MAKRKTDVGTRSQVDGAIRSLADGTSQSRNDGTAWPKKDCAVRSKKDAVARVGKDIAAARVAGDEKDKNVADEIRELAAVGCTYVEIASMVDCDIATLTRRFAQAIKEGRDEFRINLRRWQYLAAEEGSTAMLIWLGKQHLGQTDKREVAGNVNVSHGFDASKLSDEQLEQLEALVESAHGTDRM